MKKLQQVVLALVVIAAPLAVSPAASAASTCQNGYTGPDSNNICTSTTTYACTQTSENTVTIANDGTQIAVSGDASSGGNGAGGGAQTGSATNSNGVTFTVSVTNQGLCTATATVPATPTPTPTTPVKESVTPPKTTKPPVLANTSGNTVLGYAIGAIVALGAVAGIARVVTLSYSRLKS